MNLIQLVNVLESAGVGIAGETIFVNNMPSTAKTAILLRNKFTGTPIDYELPGYHKTDVMLVVRSGSYPAGEALIKQAVAALTFSETDLTEYYIRYCRPEAMYSVYPLSDGDNMEFAVRLNIAFNTK